MDFIVIVTNLYTPCSGHKSIYIKCQNLTKNSEFQFLVFSFCFFAVCPLIRLTCHTFICFSIYQFQKITTICYYRLTHRPVFNFYDFHVFSRYLPPPPPTPLICTINSKPPPFLSTPLLYSTTFHNSIHPSIQPPSIKSSNAHL